MKLFLTFIIFILVFIGINVALLDNLRKVWTVGYPILLLVINLDLLVLFVTFAIFFRKFIKTYLHTSRGLRRKLSNLLFLYLFLPILFLNVASIVLLVQSTKTLVSSQLKDVSQRAKDLQQEILKRESYKIELYRSFFKYLVEKGEDPRSYVGGLREVMGIQIDPGCKEEVREEEIFLCVGGYRVVLKRDRTLLSTAEGIAVISQQLRNMVKSRDIISGVYVYFIVLITFITLLSTVWLGQLLARHISAPLEILAEKSRELAEGNFNVHLPPVKTGDELEELYTAFSRMQNQLKTFYENLQREKEVLSILIEKLPVGVVFVDKEGRVVENDAFRRLKEEGLESPGILHKIVKLDIGEVHIYEDTRPVVLAERFKTWQDTVKRIAHEIKNPLTPISLNLEMLLRMAQKGEVCKEDMEELLKIMLEEVERIKGVVRHLRDLHYEREPQIETVDLRKLLEELARLYRDVTVEVKGDKVVKADRSMLKDFFLNLLNNSLEWGATHVKIHLYKDRLEYSDNGRGVPKGKEEEVFLPYRSGSGEGMGLGLYIVRQIAHLHGWDVRLVPEEKGFHLVVEFRSI